MIIGVDDADAFELHLRNTVNAEFGVQYVALNIKVRFHNIGGKMICEVIVSKVVDQLFVEYTNKNGARVEKFFVRSGNSSVPINNPSEVSSYITNRFKVA